MSRNQSTSHEERTSKEPREKELHRVRIQHILQINSSIRTIRLELEDRNKPVPFLPGQWLDVHIPGQDKAGGFTITSSPLDAVRPRRLNPSQPKQSLSFELAVQCAERNPAAAWLWKPENEIIGTELTVRVGGSFAWPPEGKESRRPEKVVMIAGGVGINPFASMLQHVIDTWQMPVNATLLYSTKYPKRLLEVLFLPRFQQFQRLKPDNFSFELFLTGPNPHGTPLTTARSDYITQIHERRIDEKDLLRVLGDAEARKDTVCYICGPQKMTDSLVEYLKGVVGLKPENVLCDKWW